MYTCSAVKLWSKVSFNWTTPLFENRVPSNNHQLHQHHAEYNISLLVNGILVMGTIHHVRNVTVKIFLRLFLSLSYCEWLRIGEWNAVLEAWEWDCITVTIIAVAGRWVTSSGDSHLVVAPYQSCWSMPVEMAWAYHTQWLAMNIGSVYLGLWGLEQQLYSTPKCCIPHTLTTLWSITPHACPLVCHAKMSFELVIQCFQSQSSLVYFLVKAKPHYVGSVYHSFLGVCIIHHLWCCGCGNGTHPTDSECLHVNYVIIIE